MSTITQIRNRDVTSAAARFVGDVSPTIGQAQRCSSAYATENQLVADPPTQRATFRSPFHKAQERKILNSFSSESIEEGADYSAYPGADLNDFFGESVPKSVAEVCLVNDHYILVKMPDTCWRRNSQLDCIVENVASTLELSPNDDDKDGENPCRKFSKFLQCSRSKRISPHQDDERELPGTFSRRHPELSNPRNGWQLDGRTEVFKTRSRIQPILPTSSTNRTDTPLRTTKLMHKFEQKPSTQRDARFCSPVKTTVSPNKLRSKKLCTSVHNSIQLRTQGCIIAAEKNHSELNSHPTPSTNRKCAKSPVTSAPKKPFYRPFQWFMKPFRKRVKSDRKPKSKRIQAVIQKTYFVTWNKPPEALWHGYGVRPVRSQEHGTPELRRCRSALF